MKNKSTYSPKTKILAFILTLLIIFSILPISAIAEGIDTLGGGEVSGAEAGTDSAQSAGGAGTDYSVKREVFEAVELREANVKHFRLEDGSYLAASYASPVHVLDSEGVWQDIDNRLISSGSEYATSGSRIKFAKKITGNEGLFTLHENNTKITMGLEGAIKKTEGRVTSTHDSDEEEETTLGKLMNLENLSSSIIYEDILDGVDLEYIVDSVNIKENIIVKERKDAYSYTFNIALNNLEAVLNGDGSVSIVNAAGESSYTIPAPVVYDSSYTYAPDSAAAYTLTDGGNGKYTLTVTVSADWMNAEDRAFPVVVDPSIGVGTTVTDLYISSGSADYSYSTSSSLKVGSIFTSYWKTSVIPTVPESAYVVNSTISMNLTSGTGNYIGVYKVLTDWDSTLTWNKNASELKGQLSSTVTDLIKPESTGRYTWDITAIVKDWLAGGDNYGIGIRYIKGNSAVVSSFGSFEAGSAGTMPHFAITYVDQKGLEDYWTYTSQSVGNAGNASVNLANGNLVLGIDTLGTTDYLLPITPALVYNSSLGGSGYTYPNAKTAYTASYMPYGFKLNLNETLLRKSYINPETSTSFYYVYADADGTEHYLRDSGGQTYLAADEDGMRLKLTVSADTATLTYTDGSIKTFAKSTVPDSSWTEAWYLKSISDKIGNKVTITHDSSYRPTKISLDPAGADTDPIEMLNLVYTSSGMLQAVHNYTTGEAAVFRYSSTYSGTVGTSGCYLRQVIRAHVNDGVTSPAWSTLYANGSATGITVDATASYTYNSSGAITQIKDNMSGYYVNYGYSDSRVTDITEYGRSSSQGQSIRIIYGTKYTDVKSSGNDDIYNNDDDIINRNIFDGYGRVVNSYAVSVDGTKVYSSVSGKYEEQENVRNNLKESTIVGGSPSNYIMNGTFGNNSNISFDYWEKSTNVDSEYGILEYYYAKMNFVPLGENEVESLSQYVKLKKGDYTLSFKYLAHAVDDTTRVTVRAGTLANKDISLIEAVGEETEASLTFTVAEETANVKISIEATGATTTSGSIRIDNVMLTKGIDVQPYNYVTAGHLETTSINSAGATVIAPGSLWTTESGANATIVTDVLPFDSVASLSANLGTRYVKQRFFTATSDSVYAYDYDTTSFMSNANRDYLVSGFAYATDALVSGGDFEIRIDVYYYQGVGNTDVVISHSFAFQDIAGAWQFVSGSFSGKHIAEDGDTNDYRLIHYIDVVCNFSDQARGTAYFDNISVTDCTQNSIYKYYYYADGNLAKKESRHDTVYYEYVDNSNLVSRIANNNGEIYDYTYNSYGQPIQEVYSTFTRTDGVTGVVLKYYPFGYANPDSYISKTAVSYTTYGYNNYGQLKSTTVRAASATKTISSTSEYVEENGSKIFGALKSESDGLGNTVKYFYSSKLKLQATVNTGTGGGTYYTYDAKGRIQKVTPVTYTSSTNTVASNDSAENVNYTYDSYGNLTKITTASTVYTLTYDAYGNASSIKMGDNSLAAYEYNDYNGKLKKIIYGNGFIEEYVYNDLEILEEIWYTYSDGTRVQAAEYVYTADGQLHRVDDLLSDRSTVYTYDTAGRLVSTLESDTTDMRHDVSTEILYNSNNGNISYRYVDLFYDTSSGTSKDGYNYYYTYNDDGSIASTSIRASSSLTAQYTYDECKRMKKAVFTVSAGFSNTVEYTFRETGAHTSGQIQTFTSTVGDVSTTYTYTYDGAGNITSISDSSGRTTYYKYDDRGQLIREDNPYIDRTYLYTYDNAGNRTLTDPYYYTTSDPPLTALAFSDIEYIYSGDVMTKNQITTQSYDAMGNPTVYRMKSLKNTLEWDGRLLMKVSNSLGFSAEFTYNEEGLRTSKKVTEYGTVSEYKYYYSGSQLIAEDRNGTMVLYMYDSYGSPIGIQVGMGSSAKTYWYEKNLQGDIVAIYDNAGVQQVKYSYSAFGIAFVSSGTDFTLSPFRYRGYYYDSELGLYYLNSRYYDANTGRFISPDKYVSTGQGLLGYNMYAYCNNNPVMYVDPSGHSAILSILATLGVSALVGAGIGAAGTVLGDGLGWVFTGNFEFSSTENYIGNAIGGAIGGMLSLVNPYLGTVASGTLGTFSGLAIGKATGSNEMSWGEIIINSVASLGISTLTAGLTKYIKIPGITQGSHSWQQVFNSGFTKTFSHGYNMSVKTLLKGAGYLFTSNFTTGFLASAELQSLFSILWDRISIYFNQDK